ncbi:NAD-dependent formate dehydrogenase [Staphylococcus equorum]|uniref:NAD-dependent formate dehydrogenase n=1 Tax=Staphylococcus equorum TaxID=246432 RepID=UPI0008073DFD|nr:NAD-dependent formate dehydrogenase [Staphylococcus equorum]ANR67358.1 formate dehydrogenase [Staphylococcus equorum]MCE5047739.1 NAD-dependent formate dehydrogenase [Staphylococcus equorum]MEB7670620.1 NAD-dependent formate dehydrogenase [Staphylococcus equorum]MEB7673145.1 NAD-dependent formate dehydrogenase [Staphylococcus equorum]MEB7690564.1 NAD-dependent formate dehydrogenase [Staphylococcus equorum]
MKIVGLFPSDPSGKSENQLLNDRYALGIESFLEDKDHEFVVINSDEEVDQHLEDMEVIISSPFLPAYMDENRIRKASQLKLAITAGVGSDHIDLNAASQNDLTVLEVTGCNTISVAEHTVMDVLILLRNFMEGHRQSYNGEWNLSKVGNHAHDLQHKKIGIFGYGQIGELVAERLQPFDVKVQHYRRSSQENTPYSKYVDFDELVSTSDVIVILSPLTSETDDLFNYDVLSRMKEGSYLVNTARGKIVNKDDLIELVNNNHIQGYAGDVWYPQPAPQDHPWRTMPRNAMTIHYSGMTLEAQKRIEKGVKGFLTNFFNEEAYDEKDVIVSGGTITNSSYKSK